MRNAAGRKALELDASLAHPHAILGSSEMEYEWDFAGGEAEYKKAFELDPNDATAHQWYAQDVGLIGGRETARNLVRAGVHESVAMSITGHRTSSMFKRYAIVSEEQKREALARKQSYLAAASEKKVIAMRAGK